MISKPAIQTATAPASRIIGSVNIGLTPSQPPAGAIASVRPSAMWHSQV